MKREWLIEQRKMSGKTFKQIAIECGITTQFYYYIEQGTRRPSPEIAQRIAEVLQFDWTKFYKENSKIIE